MALPRLLLSRLVYRGVILTARLLYAVMGWPIWVEGAHLLPATGPAVVIANHVSHLDPMHLGLAVTRGGRRVSFLAKRELFAVPVVGWLLRTIETVEVDRGGDAALALEGGLAALREGKTVALFPEGTIATSFVPDPPRLGAARMAVATGAPIVPCAVWGGQRVVTKARNELRPPFLRTRGVLMTVTFGAPLTPEPGEDPAHLMARAWDAVGHLADRAARTYPHQPSGPDDRWWVPAHLGGTAPSVAQALATRTAEAEARRRRRQAEVAAGGGRA